MHLCICSWTIRTSFIFGNIREISREEFAKFFKIKQKRFSIVKTFSARSIFFKSNEKYIFDQNAIEWTKISDFSRVKLKKNFKVTC